MSGSHFWPVSSGFHKVGLILGLVVFGTTFLEPSNRPSVLGAPSCSGVVLLSRGEVRHAVRCAVRGLLGSAADSFPIIPPCAFSQHLTGPVALPLW